MKVEQIYTGCLAQGAYYIESNGEAAIIDPLRETQPYIERAKENKVTIKYIFETHFHADFVSGHLDLAKKTGAQIVYGPNAQTEYEKYLAKDGEEFKIGQVTIKENGNITKEDLAGWLFDSLRNKIMPLSDEVLVYPAHGAGSACGKNMSSETWDTLGNQKKTNYALRADMTKEEFIKEVTDGLLPPPQYFSLNAQLNKKGYGSIDAVMKKGTKALSPREFEVAANETDALILDVRDKTAFVKGFIPNSIFIGLDGSFAPWVGALIADMKQPILIVAPSERNEETVKRLARVGYDNSIGYLKGGFEAWKKAGKEIDSIETIDSDKFEAVYTQNPAIQLLDVRKPSEWESAHIENSQNFALDFINKQMSEVDKDTMYYMHCRSGYRSTIAASILKARGFENMVNVQAKFDDIAASKVPTTAFVCPTTLAK